MNPRVLVVTGNLPLGDVLQDRLQQSGMQALASPPETAADRLSRWGHPDAVVWDIPAAPAEGAGAAAAALLRDLKRPAALLLLGPPGAVPRELPGGALLARPVDFETLIDALQHLLAEPKAGPAARSDRPPLEGLGAEVAGSGRASPARQGVRVRTLDLGGLSFETPVDYQTGAALTIWLPVPGETLRLRLPAEVRWCRREGARAVVGCRFGAVSSADLARLERILSNFAP